MGNAQFVALDLETTGKYPLGAEICELALIKFTSQGEVLDRYETLIRPKGKMTPESEHIHGLSLESLQESPYIEDVLGLVVEFIGGLPLVGHNLPFDLGFLAVDLGKFLNTQSPEEVWSQPHFCTSLLSLQTHPKLKSHRLAHLAEYFDVSQTPNHRAMQDAQTCMEVFLKLIEGQEVSLEALVELQKDNLLIEHFSMSKLRKDRPEFEGMIVSCERRKAFELVYSKGSKKNKWRPLEPKGLVLKTKGESFLVAVDPGEVQTKRFLLEKIKDTRES